MHRTALRVSHHANLAISSSPSPSSAQGRSGHGGNRGRPESPHSRRGQPSAAVGKAAAISRRRATASAAASVRCCCSRLESPDAADAADRGQHRENSRRGHRLKDDAPRVPELSCHQRYHTTALLLAWLAPSLVISTGDKFKFCPFRLFLCITLETPVQT